jgi:hypothetical protein
VGKYDDVLPGLKPTPVQDLKYQEKVDNAKKEITDRNAISLANEYAFLRARKTEIEKVLYDINLRLETYTQLLVESEDIGAAGWGDYGTKDNALRLPTGDQLRIDPDIFVKVIDKEAFRLWCISNGYERKLQLWPSTTASVAKERLIAGEPHPEGVEVTKRSKLVYTPFKEKE